MLSRAQQILLKRAQREAGLDDAEYREGLTMIAGCRSSTDPHMGDDHLDVLLAYFEAIYWRKVDKRELQPPCKGTEVFQQRGYWARKNTNAETSRDRYTYSTLTVRIDALEAELQQLGCGPDYCAAIRDKVTKGRGDAQVLHWYVAALEKTLKSKRKAREAAPF